MATTKLFLFGLDKAGKTTFSKYIKSNECESTRPTLAFNLDKWVIEGMEFQVWDAPGQISLRTVWKNGFQKAQVLVFVLDLSEKDRFQEAKQEFDKVLNDLETRNIPLVFCFHKIDLEEAKQNKNLAREIFKLPRIVDRKVFIFETSVHNCGEVPELKDQLVKLIQEARW